MVICGNILWTRDMRHNFLTKFSFFQPWGRIQSNALNENFFFFFCCTFICFYCLKGRVKERMRDVKRQREMLHVLSLPSTYNSEGWVRLRWHQKGNAEPLRVVASRMHASRTLELQVKPGFKFRSSDVECGWLKHSPRHCAKWNMTSWGEIQYVS